MVQENKGDSSHNKFQSKTTISKIRKNKPRTKILIEANPLQSVSLFHKIDISPMYQFLACFVGPITSVGGRIGQPKSGGDPGGLEFRLGEKRLNSTNVPADVPSFSSVVRNEIDPRFVDASEYLPGLDPTFSSTLSSK